MDEMQALFTLFERVPRQGPGLDETTLEVLGRLPELPQKPKVIDVGAGSAAAGRCLAKALGVPVEASDIHEPFLAAAREQARLQGIDHLLSTRVADMMDLGLPPASVDLLWSEGAAYIGGFDETLGVWRPMVKDGGFVVVSHLTEPTTSTRSAGVPSSTKRRAMGSSWAPTQARSANIARAGRPIQPNRLRLRGVKRPLTTATGIPRRAAVRTRLYQTSSSTSTISDGCTRANTRCTTQLKSNGNRNTRSGPKCRQALA